MRQCQDVDERSARRGDAESQISANRWQHPSTCVWRSATVHEQVTAIRDFRLLKKSICRHRQITDDLALFLFIASGARAKRDGHGAERHPHSGAGLADMAGELMAADASYRRTRALYIDLARERNCALQHVTGRLPDSPEGVETAGTSERKQVSGPGDTSTLPLPAGDSGKFKKSR